MQISTFATARTLNFQEQLIQSPSPVVNMPPTREDTRFPRLAMLAILFAVVRPAAALSLQLCSSINTGSTAVVSSIYQSDGSCYTQCLDNYAFAILSHQDCYCSDYAPSSTVNLTDCLRPCPGYPDDMCAGNGLFGYIQLSKPPSGTEGGSDSGSSTPPPAPSTSASQVTVTLDGTITTVPVTVTVTHVPSEPSTTSSSPASTSTTLVTTPSPSPSSHSTSTTWTPTPTLSLITVTGQVQTVTVTPTAPPSDSQNSVNKSTSNALGTGPIIGIVIAALVALAVGIGIGYCCMRRRATRHDDNMDGLDSAGKSSNDFIPPGGPTPPSRTMSENSRYVLGTDGTRVVETFEDGSNSSRRSRLLPVDPRVDPFSPLYQQGNKSRESFNTVNDHQDYSRKIGPNGSRPILRAMNPDADD